MYAHVSGFPLHEPARARLTELAEGHVSWSVPVFCLGEFLRVVTHPRLFDRPFSSGEACDALVEILRSPTLSVLHPGPRFLRLFLDAMREAGVTGNLVFDAQIVALCRETGVTELLTHDRDLDRFRGIRTVRLRT